MINMEQNEVILILSPTKSISLQEFTARDVLAILKSSIFLKTEHTEQGSHDLYRYDPQLSQQLSFITYYKIYQAYWVPYQTDKPTVNWDDWFWSIGEPPCIINQPSNLRWRNPTYEEAIERQIMHNRAPHLFNRIMDKNVENCDLRQHLIELKKPKMERVL
jgi:hypothetical protein